MNSQRKLPMSECITYRLTAAENARRAHQETDQVETERLLRLAEHWISMAENEEWLHHHSLSHNK
jgi:hypothetical protein